MESPNYGVWQSAKGLARLRGGSAVAQPPQSQVSTSDCSPLPVPQTSSSQASSTPPPPASPINFEETVDDYLTAFKAKLLQKLHDLSPEKFEEFAGCSFEGIWFSESSGYG
jgi:hypothetical protein